MNRFGLLLCIFYELLHCNSFFLHSLSRGWKFVKLNHGFGESIDTIVDKHSIRSLDFENILDLVSQHTVTKPGKDASRHSHSINVTKIQDMYQKVAIIKCHKSMPFLTDLAVNKVLHSIERNSIPISKEDISLFVEHMNTLVVLSNYLFQHTHSLSLFQELAVNMTLPSEFVKNIEYSFDTEGNLNGTKFESIGKLRTLVKQQLIYVKRGIFEFSSSTANHKLSDK